MQTVVSVNTQPVDNNVLRIRRGSSVPPSLQNYECPFNWGKLCPLTFTEYEHGLHLLQEKFRDEANEIEAFLTAEEDASLQLRNSFFVRRSGVRGQNQSPFTFGLSLLGGKLTEAHFNMELEKFSSAKKCLLEMEEFLNFCNSTTRSSRVIFSEEYLQGFQYILDGVKIFLEVQISNNSSSITGRAGRAQQQKESENEKIKREQGESESGVIAGRKKKVSVDGLKHFRRLPPKAKYIVWTVKDTFFAFCRRAMVEKADWMETILEMEPYIPKWHFYLYRALHGARKLVPRPCPVLLIKSNDVVGDSDGNRKDSRGGGGGSSNSGRGRPPPSPESEEILRLSGEARYLHNNPNCEGGDPLSLSYQAMCLAQILREKEGPHLMLNQFPCRFGRKLYEEAKDILKDIEGKTLQVLQMDCHLDGVYLNFAEIHLFLLSPPNQNLDLATRSLKKALRLNNSNPRTHYRMGLVQFKMRNPKLAIEHFREAIKDPNNIGALFGLIQLLMSDPMRNSVEIQSLFRLAMKNRVLTRVWDKRSLRTLHYLKGCFHFMMQENKDTAEENLHEAITSWIIAHDNESPKWSFYFLNLSHQCVRFSWPVKRLNLANVSNALKHAAYLERTQFRQLLLDICAEVDDAILREAEMPRSNSISSKNSATKRDSKKSKKD